MGRIQAALVLCVCIISPILAIPSLVVSTRDNADKDTGKEGGATEYYTKILEIYQMHVASKITNRFSNTTITSKVRNLADEAQEAYFSVVLPDTAFISGFMMEVDGKNYTAYVKEKEEARRDYNQAVARGLGAAHVAASTRDSNCFTVSVNVEPAAKAAFYLSYEQLLNRADGRYEQVINLHPGQPVKDLSVEVTITESRRITDLKAPPIRSGNEIGSENAELDPRAVIEVIDDKKAVVRFTPNIERQKQLAHLLGTDEKEGLAGQFVVQYDVARDPQGGEVLVQDGYFVHFFAPAELTPLPKHAVFVLDTSGSMSGQKIAQLKEAMNKILEQLHDGDFFSLVEFNSNVKVHDLENPSHSRWYTASYNPFTNDGRTYNYRDNVVLKTYPVNSDNIRKAKNAVSSLNAGGATDIYTALWVGLKLVELNKKQKSQTLQPLMVFLTDGQPTRMSNEQIVDEITNFNTNERKTPIFSLSFGLGADEKFLQKLSLRNSGFSKHIYEAADASLQLQDFYRQISSPLLAGVTFKYAPSITSLTTTEFPFYFENSEIVVAGRCEESDWELPTVSGWGTNGQISLKPSVERSVSNVERLWAYMTIKQLLVQKESSDEDKMVLNQKALDLALKYSFVTPVTSMVVVKPNEASTVDATEEQRPRLPPSRTGASNNQVHRSFKAVRKNNQVHRSYIAASASNNQVHRSYPARGPLGLNGPSLTPERTLYATTALRASPPDFGLRQVSRINSAPRVGIQTLALDRSFAMANFPEIQMTTEATLHTTTLPSLLRALPWLRNILNEDGTLRLPSGNKYKLGLNETVTDTAGCSNTPLNTSGRCSLLHSCPQVHSLLPSSDVFVRHMCVLRNQYAGICCPT